MNKSRQIKFAKRKHLKQLKRNAKKKVDRLHRSRISIEMQKIRKAYRDIPEDVLNQALAEQWA